MNTKSKQIRNFAWLLFVSLILNIGMAIHIGHHHSNPDTIVKTEVKFDTIVKYNYSTDTIHVKDTITKYNTKIINDTVYIENRGHDYLYSNDIYTLSVNAVKLNWYNLDIHKVDTFTFVKQVEIPVKIPSKKPRFYYGIGVGAGYGLFNKKPDLYIGFNAGLQF